MKNFLIYKTILFMMLYIIIWNIEKRNAKNRVDESSETFFLWNCISLKLCNNFGSLHFISNVSLKSKHWYENCYIWYCDSYNRWSNKCTGSVQPKHYDYSSSGSIWNKSAVMQSIFSFYSSEMRNRLTLDVFFTRKILFHKSSSFFFCISELILGH